MEPGYKRLVAALLLSVALPRLIVDVGSRLRAGEQPPQTLPPTTAASSQEQTVALWTTEQTVRIMPLEEYVRGVVLAEMLASFQPEALKAQAVAARTYALRRMDTGDKHPGRAVCTDPACCQAWISDEEYLQERGTQREWKKIATAVEDTAGQYLSYEGRPAEATYFSCSGGRTESALDVWQVDIPYLQAVDSPGEEWAAVFSAELLLTEEEFCALLGTRPPGPVGTWLGPVTKTQGGGVDTVTIGGTLYTGLEIRKKFHLKSTAFTMTALENKIYISTRGWGHRVGMSQYGAEALAKMGYLYREILEHYYPGTKIDKTADLG